MRGLGSEVFEKEPEYQGTLETVEQLGEAYLVNTTGLRRANNKIEAACIAAKRCKESGNAFNGR